MVCCQLFYSDLVFVDGVQRDQDATRVTHVSCVQLVSAEENACDCGAAQLDVELVVLLQLKLLLDHSVVEAVSHYPLVTAFFQVHFLLLLGVWLLQCALGGGLLFVGQDVLLQLGSQFVLDQKTALCAELTVAVHD